MLDELKNINLTKQSQLKEKLQYKMEIANQFNELSLSRKIWLKFKKSCIFSKVNHISKLIIV